MMREVTLMFASVELFRKRINKDMPIQHVALLLAVAENPGITMTELMRILGMPQGTLSRNVRILSRYVERKKGTAVLRGYDLLRTEPDRYGRRGLAVYLTEDGAELVRELAMTLRGRQDHFAPADRHVPFDCARPAVGEMVAAQ